MRRLPPAFGFCLATAVLAGTGCRPDTPDETDYSRVVAFDTATVRLIGGGDTLNLRVELAVTPEQKTMGLMERRSLGEHAGMLFLYDSPQPADAGFWMYRTRLPLDIAFLDSAGIIRAIKSMAPCEMNLPQGCPSYAPGVPYRYALEVNRGFFERQGMSVGDSVHLDDALSDDH